MMQKKILISVFTICAITMFVILPCSYAKEIKFIASIDRAVAYLGESIQLNLKFEGSSNIPPPDLPEIEGFKGSYLGPSTMMSIVNGRMSSSVTHMYRLVPIKTGKFKINSITFKHKGDSYKSNPVMVEVLDSAGAVSRKAVPQQETPSINLKDRVFIEMNVPKSKIYINELLPLTIKLYISNIDIRDIQYPSFKKEGLSISEFSKPRQYQESKSGLTYNVVEFRTQIFATKSGELSLGPAAIKANILTKSKRRRPSSRFDDFFGRDPFEDFFGGLNSHPIEVKSDQLTVSVLPFPAKDRPVDFKGAVGHFKMNLLVSPSEVVVGDPVTVRIEISGNGNFNTVSSPTIDDNGGFKIYDPQVTVEDDRKIFEQVLIPTNDDLKSIPRITFSFFNTEYEKYQSIIKSGVPLTVRKPEKQEKIAIVEAPETGRKPIMKEVFGRDLIYIKGTPGNLQRKGIYLYKNRIFLLLQILPLVVLVSVFMIHRKKKRLSSDVKYARRLAAPKKAKQGIRTAEQFLHKDKKEDFYDVAFKTIREYLGDRYHIPSGGITADIIDDTDKFGNVSDSVLEKLKKIFRECDMARYAPAALTMANMKNTLDDLKEAIDFLEKHK